MRKLSKDGLTEKSEWLEVPSKKSGTFCMTQNWQPGEHFESACRSAGVDLSKFSDYQHSSVVGEWRLYWCGKSGARKSQQGWELKLIQNYRRVMQTPNLIPPVCPPALDVNSPMPTLKEQLSDKSWAQGMN